MFKVVSNLLLVSAAVSVAAVSIVSVAEAKSCKWREMSITDERGGGRTLCLKKSEWRKAKRTCAAQSRKSGKRIDPMNCICQDGNSVGACGD